MDVMAYAVTPRSNHFISSCCFQDFSTRKQQEYGMCPKCGEIIVLRGWPGADFIRGLREARRAAREQHES